LFSAILVLNKAESPIVFPVNQFALVEFALHGVLGGGCDF
jgi:hypothetical protein